MPLVRVILTRLEFENGLDLVSIRDMAMARGKARAVLLNYSIRLHQTASDQFQCLLTLLLKNVVLHVTDMVQRCQIRCVIPGKG